MQAHRGFESHPLRQARILVGAQLAALSRVHGLLSRADEEPVGIGGPDVPLRRDAVQIVALAVHELATNAQKYGALAHDGGHLSVHWSVRRDGDGERLALEWLENGMAPPPGAEPAGKEPGFGRYLIEKAMPFTLRAETNYELGANGLRCTIDIPLA